MKVYIMEDMPLTSVEKSGKRYIYKNIFQKPDEVLQTK